uniref:ABC3 transporter permease C-terminal domain-containing protein n=1 Tax=Eubacterium plexicaudatum ASF492 TaxID=1235802 RepID=N2ARY6_9FIRM
MKSYLSLIPISAKVKKRQNRMTILCIVLAVFLVTIIFSMADMGIRAEKINMIYKHGNWHIKLLETDEQTARKICADATVAAASWYDGINYNIDKDYHIDGKKTALCGVNESFITAIRTNGYEGTFPKNTQEIMLTSNAKEIGGIRIGDRITLHTPAGDLHYTVSGFQYDDSAVFYDAYVAFFNKEAFDSIYELTKSSDSYPEYYIQFEKHTNVRKAIATIKDQYDLSDEKIAENTALMGLDGFSSNSYVAGMYGIAAILVILVLAAGVLMIASSMNSIVAQQTQFFGMLRCIGASKKQIVRFVRLEALYRCKTAIPAGIGTAVIITWILCALLRFFVGGEFANMPVFAVSPVGIACGVIIGIVTVLISAERPAKYAARVSPVAAVSGSADTTDPIRHSAALHFGHIETALGMHHALTPKKNVILMTLSFAISIVLFFAFSSFLAFVRHALPSLRSYTPDVAITDADGACTIDRSLYAEIGTIQGVSDMYASMFQLHTPVKSDRTDEVDLISYDTYMLNWSEHNALINGNLAEILGDSNSVFTIHNKTSTLRKGDRIQIGEEQLEIAGELSAGIWSDGKATVICSEQTFTRLTGKSDYTILNLKFDKDISEKTVAQLRSLASPYTFTDYREINRQNRNTYLLFHILVYGFLTVIAVITIFNIMNSISMSVTAKMNRYGMMRAIGMESGQLTKMILTEAVTYAIPGSIIGSAAGIAIHKLFFETAITSYFGDPWTFPVSTMAVILITVTFSCIAAVYVPSGRIKNLPITRVIANER